jgi:hypothetical protein
MQVTGKIKVINETQEVSASFKKRELVVTTEESYPQHILIEFNQDKCSVLDNYNVNDNVVVDINLRGREWTNPEGVVKYFNQIQGWKISKDAVGEITQPTQVNNVQVNNAEILQTSEKESEDASDLPF